MPGLPFWCSQDSDERWAAQSNPSEGSGWEQRDRHSPRLWPTNNGDTRGQISRPRRERGVHDRMGTVPQCTRNGGHSSRKDRTSRQVCLWRCEAVHHDETHHETWGPKHLSDTFRPAQRPGLLGNGACSSARCSLKSPSSLVCIRVASSEPEARRSSPRLLLAKAFCRRRFPRVWAAESKEGC